MHISIIINALTDTPIVRDPTCTEEGCTAPCDTRRFDQYYNHCKDHRSRHLFAIWRRFSKSRQRQSHRGAGAEVENGIQNNAVADHQLQPVQAVEVAELLVEPLEIVENLTAEENLILSELGFGYIL